MARIKTLCLISCVSRKKAGIHPARDIYDSALFRKARAYAERHADEWFILSAKHGLLSPETPIRAYNVTLNRMPAAARRKWADRVLRDLRSALRPRDRVVILAGKRYREFLLDEMERMCAGVTVPMEGLGIGRQLQWLTRHG
jgi:hypothetical protein